MAWRSLEIVGSDSVRLGSGDVGEDRLGEAEVERADDEERQAGEARDRRSWTRRPRSCPAAPRKPSITPAIGFRA